MIPKRSHNEEDKYFSLESAAAHLRGRGIHISVAELRDRVDRGDIQCAVYWLTMDRWVHVDAANAAHHETHGWPRCADLALGETIQRFGGAEPILGYFSDKVTHSWIDDRLGRSPGLRLANFRPDLFISETELDALEIQAGKRPKPIQRSQSLEREIIQGLIDLGYDPTNLPRGRKGGVTPKTEVFRRIYGADAGNPENNSAFKKAYQALRDAREIIDSN
jgi:hypothetical protein